MRFKIVPCGTESLNRAISPDSSHFRNLLGGRSIVPALRGPGLEFRVLRRSSGSTVLATISGTKLRRKTLIDWIPLGGPSGKFLSKHQARKMLSTAIRKNPQQARELRKYFAVLERRELF